MEVIHSDMNGNVVSAIKHIPLNGDVDGSLYQIRNKNKITHISFQKGAVPEVGVNGITNEALISILMHRTATLDKKVPCDENKEALRHLAKAFELFNTRAAKRIIRNIEGTAVV